MKKFIKQGLGFGLIVFIWLSVLQLIIDCSVKGKNPRGHDNFELIKNTNVDCIFLGNSRCLTGVDPHTFDSITQLKSLNLGANGQSNYLFYTIRLKHYLKYNKSPKYCFVLNEPYSSTVKNKNYFLDYARYSFNWFNFNNDYIDLLNYFEVDFIERYLPSFAVLKYRVLWDILFNNNGKEYRKYGFDHYEPNNFCLEQHKPFTSSMWRQKDSLFKDQMCKFDLLCKENNITCINFQLPITSSKKFKNIFEKNKNLSIASNIKFIDLQRDSLTICKYFTDRYHPNYIGAKIFTSILATDFINIKPNN